MPNTTITDAKAAARPNLAIGMGANIGSLDMALPAGSSQIHQDAIIGSTRQNDPNDITNILELIRNAHKPKPTPPGAQSQAQATDHKAGAPTAPAETHVISGNAKVGRLISAVSYIPTGPNAEVGSREYTSADDAINLFTRLALNTNANATFFQPSNPAAGATAAASNPPAGNPATSVITSGDIKNVVIIATGTQTNVHATPAPSNTL